MIRCLIGLVCLSVGCSSTPSSVAKKDVPVAKVVRRVPSPLARSTYAVVLDQGMVDALPPGDARVGDVLIKNALIWGVIAAADHRSSGALGGGHLLDVGPTGHGDYFGGLVPIFDPDGARSPRITEVTVVQSGEMGGMAIVRARGVDPLDDQIEVDVDYIIQPESTHVRVLIGVRNSGRGHYKNFNLGVLAEWGATRRFVPGDGHAVAGRETHSDWMGANRGEVGLVISSERGRLRGRHGADWSALSTRARYLRPGGFETEELRVFVSAQHGIAGALQALRDARQTIGGLVSGRVMSGDQPVEGAAVYALDRWGKPALRAVTDSVGEFALPLRSGHYALLADGPGRAPSELRRLDLTTERDREVRLDLGPPSALAFTAEGPDGSVEARIRVRRVGASDITVEAYTQNRQGKVPLVPGRYEVIVSAGPAYGLSRQLIQLGEGATVSLEARLSRQIETAGWFGLDPSVPVVSGTEIVDRLAACRADGVDAVVLLDERRTPTLNAEAQSVLPAFTGLRASAPEMGRFAAFPLPAGTRSPPLGGRPDWLLTGLKTLKPTPLAAVLAPRSAGWGYFKRFSFDPRVPQLPRGGFSLDFELLDVAGTAGRAGWDRALLDYFGLLNRGRRILPIAGSGAGETRSICGMPRTWVRGALPANAAALNKTLRAGNVVASFGPLLTFTVDDVEPGGSLPFRDKYRVRVRIQAPKWAKPEIIRIVADGRTVIEAPLPVGEAGIDHVATWILGGKHRWIVAIVEGPQELESIVGRPASPMAITSPIWIE